MNEEAAAETLAWQWFALHSSQRMQLLNFWLVAEAFVAAAYVQAATARLIPLAVGVAGLGALTSIAFRQLDERTRRLTSLAESALAELEEGRILDGRAAFRLATGSDSARTSRYMSYRIIIQCMQLIVASLFVGAIVYAIVGLP